MPSSSYNVILTCIFVACLLVALNSFQIARNGNLFVDPQLKPEQPPPPPPPPNYENNPKYNPLRERRCAINMFGLPRAFKSLVLPSLKMNVIPINPACDYFVHFYNKSHEEAGRSGEGGKIHVQDILLLQDAVHETNPRAQVHFVEQTEQDFEKQRQQELAKITNNKHFQPKEFDLKTTQNIIKMWHSIQSAWDLMENYSQFVGFQYDRVAMLRSDVVYATPLDVWEIPNNQQDTENQYAVIPAFASWPVNDRMIYGPHRAVREWAARRFQLMNEHVRWTRQYKRGFGIHSEVFVAHRLLPNIRKLGYQVWEHDKLCFMRARPDETIWLNDCDAGNDPDVADKAFGGMDCIEAVEKAINRTCVPGTKAWIEKTKTVTLLCRER